MKKQGHGKGSDAERSDILFYLVYAILAKYLKKREITFADIKSYNLDLLTEEEINITKGIIFSKYKELGANGRVAKSSGFIDIVDLILGI